MIWEAIIKPVLYGACTGIALAASGYLKHKPLPEFNSYKFLQTVIVGAMSGAVMAYYGVTFETAQDWVAAAGLTTLVEYAKKVLKHYLTE